MSKLRVVSQAQAVRPQTADLEAAWDAVQRDLSTEQDVPVNDEITIMDNATGNLVTIFMKPDGTAILVQPIVIEMKRQPVIEVPISTTGEVDWQSVIDSAGIGPSGYTVQPYGPGVGAPTVTAHVSNDVYKKALFKLLSGYSAKREYLESLE